MFRVRRSKAWNQATAHTPLPGPYPLAVLLHRGPSQLLHAHVSPMRQQKETLALLLSLY
jgi:hypothetical protein